MRVRVDNSQIKKQKQTINKNKMKKSYVNRTHGYEMTINDNKKKSSKMERAVVVCHKLTNDGGALAMMCGKNEEHQLSAIAR